MAKSGCGCGCLTVVLGFLLVGGLFSSSGTSNENIKETKTATKATTISSKRVTTTKTTPTTTVPTTQPPTEVPKIPVTQPPVSEPKTLHFILNLDTNCVHKKTSCPAAEQILPENYSTIDIREDELGNYAYIYWACGRCSKEYSSILPKFD